MNKRRTTIALLGVDGAGKSAATSNLQRVLGDKCIVTYMGGRSFEDNRVETLSQLPHKTILDLIKLDWFKYKCFLKRYKDSISQGKIIIFDRYVQEQYLNALGLHKLLNIILYKYLYPKSDITIYLFCPADVSFSRKADILDKKTFIAMKNRFDKEFKNKKNVLCVNTQELSEEDVTTEIVKHLTNKGVI